MRKKGLTIVVTAILIFALSPLLGQGQSNEDDLVTEIPSPMRINTGRHCIIHYIDSSLATHPAHVGHPEHVVVFDEVKTLADILDNTWDLYVSEPFGFTAPLNPVDVYVYYLDYNRGGYFYGPIAATATPSSGYPPIFFDSYWLGNSYYVDTHGMDEVKPLHLEEVAAHELFHIFQRNYPVFRQEWPEYWGGATVTEGQAKAIVDMLSDDIDQANPLELGEGNFVEWANNYLSNPSVRFQNLGYSAALFWKYAMEKLGTVDDEPHRGIDFLAAYWQAFEEGQYNPNFIGEEIIDPFNAALEILSRAPDVSYEFTFNDVFCDFVVANYAKDLHGLNVNHKYRYVDEAQNPGSYNSMDFLHINDVTPSAGVSYQWTNQYANSWTPYYYRYNCDSQTGTSPTDYTYYTIEIESKYPAGDPWDLFMELLVDDTFNILFECNTTGDYFLRTFHADPENIVVIIAGLDEIDTNPGGDFDLSMTPFDQINLEIIDPLGSHPESVGFPDSPDHFLVTVDVRDGQGQPVRGLQAEDFAVNVGVETANILSCVYDSNAQVYNLDIAAPIQSDHSLYDLQVALFDISETEPACVEYEERFLNTMLVIDQSGSMNLYEKMDIAKDKARLYVNSFESPNWVGLVEFNETARLLHELADAGVFRSAIIEEINGIKANGATSIGGGLLVAQEELVDKVGDDHLMHIVLLSDGRENTLPWISAVRSLIESNNIRLDVILIGDDAQVGLLEEFATATGGTLEFAPEPSSGTLATELASAYRAIAEDVLGQQRVYSSRDELTGLWKPSESFYLDEVDEATVVFSYKASDSLSLANPQIIAPDGSIFATYFSEEQAETSTNRYGHFLWNLPSPEPGEYSLNISGAGDIEYFFEVGARGSISMSIWKDTSMIGLQVSEKYTVLVSLADESPILGANVVAEISTGIDYDNIITWNLTLYDDGLHKDGSPNDGLYGNIFTRTTGLGMDVHNETGITFTVNVKANGTTNNPGFFTREATGAFHLIIPEAWDGDADDLPDVWENLYGLDSSSSAGMNGRSGDPDMDGLSNFEELSAGTSPVNSDTDGGGESDYSEVQFGRDPYSKEDDYFYDATNNIGKRPGISLTPGNQNVTIRYYLTHVDTNLTFQIFRSDEPVYGYQMVAQGLSGNRGTYLNDGLTNNQTYFYKIMSVGPAGERSGYSVVESTTPKLDVTPPHGLVSINHGAENTTSLDVTLHILATADAVEIRISNNPRFDNATWEVFDTTDDVPWTLDGEGTQAVYVQFRDAFGNVGEGFNGNRAFDTIIVNIVTTPPPGPIDPLLLAAAGAGALILLVIAILEVRRRQ
ncbi:MAG: VWA domain-containing protein [Candidatus Thorarchaeota archaeon]